MDKLKHIVQNLNDVYISSDEELKNIIDSLKYLNSYFNIEYKNHALWINLKKNSIILENEDLVSLYGGKYSARATCDFLLENKNIYNLLNLVEFEESPFGFYSLDTWDFLKNFDTDIFNETINLMQSFDVSETLDPFEDNIKISYVDNNVSFKMVIDENLNNSKLKLLNEQLKTLIKFKTLNELKKPS